MAKRSKPTVRNGYRIPPPKPENRPCPRCGLPAVRAQTYAGPVSLDPPVLTRLGELVQHAFGIATYRLTERSCERRSVVEISAGVPSPSNVYRAHCCANRPLKAEHIDLSAYATPPTTEALTIALSDEPPY